MRLSASQISTAPRQVPLLPRISIVTPNYNGAAFIEATLQSVVGQDYPDLEYIVIDGGSDDASLEIIRKYENRIARLIVEKDKGHADALNKGFRCATGDILGWINSDDVLLSNALFFVGRLFRDRPDIDWITGRATSMDEAGEIRWIGPLRAWSRLRFLSGDNRWIQQESTFWRRSLWERAGPFLDERYDVANDFELWARLFRHAELHTVNRPLGSFRVREGQRSIRHKAKYDREARRILARERAALEPDFRRAYGGLFPRRAKPPVSVRRDFRYALGDPPVIRPLAVARPKAAVSPIQRPTVADDLSRFKNTHKGERCFIMGNGPSLNRMDLSKLAGETVFACNSAFLLFDRIAWRPQYYACVDSRVLPDRAPEIDAMLRAHPAMTGFFPAALQEHTGAKKSTPTRLVLPAGPNRFFFNEVANSEDDLPSSMFSTDIDDRVVQPFTVAVTMLQIAAYMGFGEIFLIGCDTDYVVTETVRREKDREGSEIALTSRKDDDPNHFDRAYFGRDRKWHAPRPEKMILHYEHAKAALDAIGVSVYNATVGGKLEVFPRRDFDSLFVARRALTVSSEIPPRQPGADPASGVSLRARIAALLIASASVAVGLAAWRLSGANVYFWLVASFLFLLGLIVYAALRLRRFIADLSAQMLDIADGAGRPPAGSVLQRLEIEDELMRLREDIEKLKGDSARDLAGGV